MAKSRVWVLVGIGFGVSAALAAVLWSVRSSGMEQRQSRAAPVAGCDLAPVPPRNTEVNTSLDPEQGVLEYRFRDPASDENRVGRIDYRVCRRLELQPLVSHVLAVYEKQRR